MTEAFSVGDPSTSPVDTTVVQVISMPLAVRTSLVADPVNLVPKISMVSKAGKPRVSNAPALFWMQTVVKVCVALPVGVHVTVGSADAVAAAIAVSASTPSRLISSSLILVIG